MIRAPPIEGITAITAAKAGLARKKAPAGPSVIHPTMKIGAVARTATIGRVKFEVFADIFESF